MASRLDRLIVAIKRGETPAARMARDLYRRAITFNLPVNALSAPVYAGLYRATELGEEAWELVRAKLVYEPMARARFHKVGERLQLGRLPLVRGHARISIGDDVYLGAGLTIETGRYIDQPELIIGNNVTIATDCYISVSKRVTIGNHVAIASRVEISDGDGHPTDPDARMRGELLSEADLLPITIEDRAWLGRGVRVLKGVTVGEGAIVAAGSTVASDIPPGSLAMGVPARVVKRG